MTRRVTILGSTGSIGQNTLDLIRRAEPGAYQIVAMTANSNVDKLVEQALEFKPQFVALADEAHGDELKAKLANISVEIELGDNAVKQAAEIPTDFVMAAIVGSAGLVPTLAAVEQGAHIGLANKECLVCAGDLFMRKVKAHGATLLPVDSEHNAIFQVLERDKPKGVKRLILTASGGPFREKTKEELYSVTRSDALNHPVWSMGAKISIDSATLMNKGLELIEAHFLFDRPSSEIDVIVHPQSIVHSMVEYIDGSVLAQMGSPDMRTPIAYALGWPDRMEAPVDRLNLAQVRELSFFEPDVERFPCLRLAREAMEMGGSAPNVLNAANEIAVAAFLDEQIKYLDIPSVVETCLERSTSNKFSGYDSTELCDILAVDELTRQTAQGVIKGLCNFRK